MTRRKRGALGRLAAELHEELVSTCNYRQFVAPQDVTCVKEYIAAFRRVRALDAGARGVGFGDSVR